MTRIYVSSTYTDLRTHRERVYKALRSMRYDVIAMEDYVATDKRPLIKCLKDVKESDLYIGILAWRYGYVPKKDNPQRRSITELEFRQAIESGIRCLLFLHDENSGWPPSMMDTGEALQNIKALRAEVSEKFTVSFFTDAENLAAQVTAAVSGWQREQDEAGVQPAAGLDLGAKAMYAAVLSELKQDMHQAVSEVAKSYLADRFQAADTIPDGLAPPSSQEQVTATEPETESREGSGIIEALQGTAEGWGLSAARAFQLPLVSRISLEVGPYLASKMRGDASGNLSERPGELFEEMRSEIFFEYGIRVPGIHIRQGLGDEHPYAYVISINEIPMVSGAIHESARLCPVDSTTLGRLGIKAEATVNPSNGAEATWVRRGNWPGVKRAQLPLWDVIEYPIRHLHSVILKNLAEFIGVQDAYDLLQEKDPDLVSAVWKSGNFVELRTVLGILANELVSISQIDKIAAAYAEYKEQGAHVLEIVEYIRSLPVFRPILPGNTDDAKLYTFDVEIIEMIDKGLQWTETNIMLKLLPEEVTEISEAMRKVLVDNRYAVWIVEDAHHRRAVRKLAELEFPWLPVLAKAELIPELKDQIATAISISG